MKNSLEKSKVFPVLAWAAIIGFAFVTLTLTEELQYQAAEAEVFSALPN